MKNILKTIRLSRKYLSLCVPSRRRMLAIGVVEFALLEIYASLIGPALISLLYGALEEGTVAAVYAKCSVCAVIVLIFCLVCYINDVYVDLNNFKIQEEIFAGSCAALYDLPMDSAGGEIDNAQLQVRLDSGSGSADSVFIFLFIILGNTASTISLLIMAGAVSWVLLALSLLALLLGVLMTRYETSRLKKYVPRQQELESQSNARMDFAVRRVRLVRINGMDEIAYAGYRETRKAEWGMKWQTEKLSFLSSGITGAFGGMLKGVLGWRMYAAYDEGRMSDASVASSFSIYDKMRDLAKAFPGPFGRIQSSLVQLERMDEILPAKEAQTEQTEQAPVLSMHDVAYLAETKTLIQQINCQVRAGERVAIVGGNGSGKTTLLRVLCGLYKPAAGDARINGKAAHTLDVAARRQSYTYIPAAPGLYEGSADDNIRMNADESEAAALEQKKQWAEIAEIGQENVTELSGGQRQRVSLVRGSMHKAPLLVADEPTAGLSAAQGNRILSELLSAYDTCVVTTHQKEHIPLFTRVIVMQDGRMQADLPADDFLSSQWYARW